MKIAAIYLLLIFVISCSTIAEAAVINLTTGNNATFSASSTDLINVGQSTLTSINQTSGSANFSSNVNFLNDGGVYSGLGFGRSEPTLTPSNGSTVLVLLNTTLNSLGYDISSVVSLTGTSQGRAGQKFDLAYSVIGSSAFIPVTGDTGYTINRNSGSQGEVQVRISGDGNALLASGVDALRFTFYNAPNESMYREIDVFGSATQGNSAPETTTISLLALGILSLVVKRRRIS